MLVKQHLNGFLLYIAKIDYSLLATLNVSDALSLYVTLMITIFSLFIYDDN